MITTGSIRKRTRTDGSHYWQITVELPRDKLTGKRIRKYKSVDGKKKDAELEMKQFIRKIELGYYKSESKITIHEWMDTWFDTYVVDNVSPTTASRYKGMISRYIKPALGNIMLQDLNMLTVQTWVNSLKISPVSGKPMSASTIKHIFDVLRGACDKAMLLEIIPKTPCAGISLPRGAKKAAVVFDEKQIRQLIAAAEGTDMELILHLEICAGLRRGELLGLRWCDVDFEKQQIHIVRTRVVVDGEVIVKEPKTESSCRTVDVPEQLIQKLKQHKAKCMANRLRLGPAYKPSDYVIVNENGKEPYPESISQRFSRMLKAANLPHARFHDLRHLCASIMLMQGVNVKIAQNHLGHACLQTTMSVYTHVLPSVSKEAAQKIGALVYEAG